MKRGWAMKPAQEEDENKNKNSPADPDPDRTYIIASRSADHVFPLLPAPETLSEGGTTRSAASATDVKEAFDSRKQLQRSQDRHECVRGKLHISGYIIRPIQPPPPSGAAGTKTNEISLWSEVSLVAHSELGGNIPTSL